MNCLALEAVLPRALTQMFKNCLRPLSDVLMFSIDDLDNRCFLMYHWEIPQFSTSLLVLASEKSISLRKHSSY